jgi:hypothetical protein
MLIITPRLTPSFLYKTSVLNNALKEENIPYELNYNTDIDILLVRVKFIDKDRTKTIMAMSKPCTNCLQWLKIYKIRNIYYTNHDGQLICENIKKMTSDHQSKKVKFNIKPKSKSESKSK